MAEQAIQWDLEFDELKSNELLTQLLAVSMEHPWVVMPSQDLGRCMIRVLGEAQRLSAMSAAAKIIAGGQAPEDFSIASVLDTVSPKIGDRDEMYPIAEKMGTLPWHQLADHVVLQAIRSTRFAKRDDKGITRYDYPPPEQMQGIAVPVTVLGIAALAALSYWGAEHSADVAAVEVEKAWAMAKAYSEIRIAEAQIANGQKPTLSDWAGARLGVAKLTTSSWWPYAAIGVGALMIGGAAMLARPSSARQNPRTRQLSMFDKRSDPRQQSLPYNEKRKPKRRRNACNVLANPTRQEFIGEARASGATPAQAASLWRGYLAGQRSKAGRRGGKARSRRRNPPAAGAKTIRALPAPRGNPSLAATSSAPRLPKPAAKQPARSKRRAPSAKRASPNPAKRARPSAKRSAVRAPRVAKSSGPKRAKR